MADKNDKEVRIVKDDEGNERKVIRFKADPGNFQFKITPPGK